MASLPLPRPHQSYIAVSPLDAGSLTLPGRLFLDPVPPEGSWEVSALSFLLRHSTTKDTFVLDVGIPNDLATFPPTFTPILPYFEPIRVHNAANAVAQGGVDPKDVAHVCLSHIHCDHIGDPKPFTNSTFLIGSEARPLIEHAYPDNPSAKINKGLVPLDRTIFLDVHDEEWVPIGTFPRALDFYGDGSMYIVEAAGHAPGHINVLARTSADGAWVYLAGDSAHDRRIVYGEAHIAYREGSEKHLARLRELLKVPRVQLSLAHDGLWYSKNKSGPAYLPGHLPPL